MWEKKLTPFCLWKITKAGTCCSDSLEDEWQQFSRWDVLRPLLSSELFLHIQKLKTILIIMIRIKSFSFFFTVDIYPHSLWWVKLLVHYHESRRWYQTMPVVISFFTHSKNKKDNLRLSMMKQ
jgi:hypothetical protein